MFVISDATLRELGAQFFPHLLPKYQELAVMAALGACIRVDSPNPH